MPLPLSNVDLSILQEFFLPSDQTDVTMDFVVTEPYLEITVQPCDKFRFRYYSEPGSHGVITGKCRDGKNKKIFPTVKLVDPCNTVTGKVLIKVRLHTADDNPRPHVLSCLSKNYNDKNQDGGCYEELPDDSVVQFKNLGIFTLKRDEIVAALELRKKQELGIRTLNRQQKEAILDELKSFNLNETRLCFEAVYKDDLTPVGCEAVLSDPICNSKATATSDLKICRLSLYKGSTFGDEEMILLCDKIKKEDIEIRFYEISDTEEGGVVWESCGKFNSSDVHHQVAIPFKIPKYEGTSSGEEIKVYIQLYRKSDSKYGDPVPFVYKCDYDPVSKKRKTSQSDGTESDISECTWNIDELMKGTYDFPELFPDVIFSDSGLDSMLSNEPSEHSSTLTEDYVKKDAVDASVSLIKEEKEKIVNITVQLNSLSLNTPVKKGLGWLKELLMWFSKRVQNLIKDKEILLYAPKTVIIQDCEENSLLHLAIMAKENMKFIEAILKLVKEDVVNHRNLDQKTPMHLATQQGNVELLILLRRNGGDAHLTDKQGNNCLHLAVMHNFPECLETLTSYPCDEKHTSSKINAENDDGLTPIHLCIMNNLKNCLTILLKNNADVNESEKKGGKSPLHLAVEKKSPLLEIILSQPKINIYNSDYHGLTALESFCEENELLYDSIPDEVKDNKEQLFLFLKQELNIDTESNTCSSQINLETEEQDLQKKIESSLNESTDWRKLGAIMNYSESKLDCLKELDDNPAGVLIEKIKKEKQLDLKEIINQAGLTHTVSTLVSNLNGW